MRLLTFLLFILASSAAWAQPDNYVRLVSEMSKMDRLERMRLAESVQVHGREAPQTQSQWRRMAKIDSIHVGQLYEMMKNPGFKQILGKGGDTAHGLWLLVMHQDNEPYLQNGLLEVMRAEKNRGNVILRDLAFLEDRVAVNSGDPQVYGTQTFLDEKKDKYVPFDYIKKGLNKRRKSMSLKSLKTQLKEENKRHKVKF